MIHVLKMEAGTRSALQVQACWNGFGLGQLQNPPAKSSCTPLWQLQPALLEQECQAWWVWQLQICQICMPRQIWSLFIFLVLVLLRIGIITIFERKVLRLSQMRRGPSKAGAWGIIQPLVDGLKLMTKEACLPQQISRSGVFLIPRIFFVLIIQVWASIGSNGMLNKHVLGALLMLALLGLMVYSTLLIGVTSYSKFGIIGGMRAASQSVSYEIVLSILLFANLLMANRPHLTSLLLTPTILLLLAWWICMVAESNRAPFDFAKVRVS